jgi:hypothetical protein
MQSVSTPDSDFETPCYAINPGEKKKHYPKVSIGHIDKKTKNKPQLQVTGYLQENLYHGLGRQPFLFAAINYALFEWIRSSRHLLLLALS